MTDREVLIGEAKKETSKIRKTILYWLAGIYKVYSNCNIMALNNGVLYSYGTHYPMAIKVSDNIYLVNTDRYSPSTSRHCWETYWLIRENGGIPLRVSLNLLDRVFWLGKEKVELIDWRGEENLEKDFYDKEVAKKFLEGFKITRGWRANIRKADEYDYWIVETYRPQFLLFKKGEDNSYSYWLMGYDERYQFIAELPKVVSTIEEALEALAPAEVMEAEDNRVPIYRQGEWFFVRDEEATKIYPKKPTEATEKRLGISVKKRYKLIRGEQATSHVATYVVVNKDDEVFVRGTIRHPEHRILRLNGGWYKVYTNRAVRSFSERGVID